MSFGDRPNFPLSNQRLDKVDVEAISDLIEESMMRMWAGIMGPSSGLLSDVSFSWSSPNLTIGACRLGYCAIDGDVSDGGIVRHDPDITGTSSLNLTAYIGSTCWLFFKRLDKESDEENRAYWDGLAQEKKVGLANTRMREYAGFAVSATLEDADSSHPSQQGYHPFAYIGGWVTGDPAVTKIHYFEAGQYNGLANSLLFQRGGTVPASIAEASINERGYETFAPRGVAQLARAILARLCTYMDSTWVLGTNFNITTAGSVGWNTTPTRGLKQINDLLDNTVIKPLFLFAVSVSGGNYDSYLYNNWSFTPPVVVGSESAWGSSKRFIVTVSNIPEDMEITGVNLTNVSGAYPLDLGGALPNPVFPVIGKSQPLPLAGTATNDLIVEVGFVYKDVTDTDPTDYTRVMTSFTLVIYGRQIP